MSALKIIEDYVEEVSLGLAYIASAQCTCLTLEEKIEYFEHCQRAYGQPALMFSAVQHSAYFIPVYVRR